MTRFEALPQAIVMVVEGAAFGGGLGLLCAGDVVLATADTRFAMSETGLGFRRRRSPRLSRPESALRARAGSRSPATASTAVRRSASGWSTSPVRTRRCWITLANVLAEIDRCAPGANAAIKRLLLAGRTLPRDQLLDELADAFAACLRGVEGQEGVTAFLEKRKPNWA